MGVPLKIILSNADFYLKRNQAITVGHRLIPAREILHPMTEANTKVLKGSHLFFGMITDIDLAGDTAVLHTFLDACDITLPAKWLESYDCKREDFEFLVGSRIIVFGSAHYKNSKPHVIPENREHFELIEAPDD